ncbi:conjugal transfer protein TraH, partial [Neisseria gonorrhoeae]
DKDKYTVGIQSFEPKILSIQDLLNGKNNAGGEIREKVVLDMWTCKDGSKKLMENCTEKNDVEIPSLRYMVHKRIETLPTAIRNNQGWNLSTRKQIAAIVNNSKLPILKMAVSDAFLGTGYLKKTAVLDAIAVDIMANIL